MADLFQLIIAITIATVLSHISLLLILGRREELYRGMDSLTAALAGDTHPMFASTPGPVQTSPPCLQQPQAPRLPYPAYQDQPIHIPQATPAHAEYGAPLTWQNPAMGSAPAPQGPSKQSGSGHCFTNNYYVG